MNYRRLYYGQATSHNHKEKIEFMQRVSSTLSERRKQKNSPHFPEIVRFPLEPLAVKRIRSATLQSLTAALLSAKQERPSMFRDTLDKLISAKPTVSFFDPQCFPEYPDLWLDTLYVQPILLLYPARSSPLQPLPLPKPVKPKTVHNPAKLPPFVELPFLDALEEMEVPYLANAGCSLSQTAFTLLDKPAFHMCPGYRVPIDCSAFFPVSDFKVPILDVRLVPEQQPLQSHQKWLDIHELEADRYKPPATRASVRFSCQDKTQEYVPILADTHDWGLPFKVMVNQDSEFAMSLAQAITLPTGFYSVILEMEASCMDPIDLILCASSAVLICRAQDFESPTRFKLLIEQLNSCRSRFKFLLLLLIGQPSNFIALFQLVKEYWQRNFTLCIEVCSDISECSEILNALLADYCKQVTDKTRWQKAQHMLDEEMGILGRVLLQCDSFNACSAQLVAKTCEATRITLPMLLRLKPESLAELQKLQVPQHLLQALVTTFQAEFLQ